MTTDQFFSSNGVQIHYTDQGVGEPVVLMHGLTGNFTAHWFDTGIAQTLLEHGYRVLALDARAHGKSGCPHDPKEYGQEMALDIARLLAHVGLEKAHIVGYSMGAAIGVKLLSLHPELLMSLTLGANGWDKQMGPDENMLALAAAMEAGQGFVPLFRFLYPDMLEPDLQERSDARMATLPDAEAMAAFYRSDGLGVSEETLRANTVPTLAIVGSLDPLKARADALDGVMAHFEKVVIPGADHASCLTHPVFIDTLLRFLAAHSANSPA